MSLLIGVVYIDVDKLLALFLDCDENMQEITVKAVSLSIDVDGNIELEGVCTLNEGGTQ